MSRASSLHIVIRSRKPDLSENLRFSVGEAAHRPLWGLFLSKLFFQLYVLELQELCVEFCPVELPVFVLILFLELFRIFRPVF